MTVTPEMIARVDAAQAVLDEWRDKPFRLGRRDCARMVAWHLRHVGHAVRLPPSGSYASPRSARAALAKRGFADLIEAIDSFGFDRIPPSAARPGDIVAVPGEGDIGCLMVVLSNGRAVGYHEDLAGAGVLQPEAYVAAWRVPIGGGA